MKIGCHASVWTGTFDEAGLRTAFEGTAKAGFDLIELPLFHPDDWNVELTKALAAEHGLAVTASLGLTDDINISSEDTAVVERGEKHLTKILEILHELGSSHLVGVIYGPMKKHMRTATELEVQHGQEAIGRLADRAAELGIRLGLEVVNHYETNILNTAKQAVAYVEQVGRDNVGAHIDTYHMNIEESSMFEPVLAAHAAGRLEYVHIGESHRGYLGTGSVDFDTFFKALGHVRYDGPIVFESFSSAVVDPQLTATLGIWRNLWQDGADLAAHANAFIRGHLHAVETIALH
ncbi:D-tagatose 3-epimerase [Paramicrobacterium humi]|uniref:D-tagatose 3-epimerase n=1 Tax=Paramicrobacterium humi TaxID=640635 RepID=A0A1H4JM08_9MICO|nr:sugar phosphate isomerase/epimerase [Microbacterium humi]SEB47187.1 D-tagatose 3-epimerase [Microbacterium humi]